MLGARMRTVRLSFRRRLRAARLGLYCNSWAARRTRWASGVSVLAFPLSTRDTVAADTPAALATSAMVAIAPRLAS